MNREENLNHKIKELKDKARNCANIDFPKIEQAIEFGKKAHTGQYRKKGDLFCDNPLYPISQYFPFFTENWKVDSKIQHHVLSGTSFRSDGFNQFVRAIPLARFRMGMCDFSYKHGLVFSRTTGIGQEIFLTGIRFCHYKDILKEKNFKYLIL